MRGVRECQTCSVLSQSREAIYGLKHGRGESWVDEVCSTPLSRMRKWCVRSESTFGTPEPALESGAFGSPAQSLVGLFSRV